MDSVQYGGRSLLVKDGTIETIGNHELLEKCTVYSVIVFADGEIARNVVVDGVLDGYVGPGWSGKFVMLRKSGKLLLLAADIAGKGVRVSDEATWRTIAGAVGRRGAFFLVAGLLLAIVFVGIPIALFGIALLLFSGTWVGVADFCTYLRMKGLPQAIPGQPTEIRVGNAEAAAA